MLYIISQMGGLPSGTKWASCNVGATKPEEYGSYFAWGEPEEVKFYHWVTYTHCDGSSSTCHNLGSDIAGTKYDVAHEKCGGCWRMPTLKQIKELLDNCTTEWTEINGVKGRKFTSKINLNSIFLPAAGYRIYYLDESGSFGLYWSSTQYPSNTFHAYGLGFSSGGTDARSDCRYRGRSVRPICRF